MQILLRLGSADPFATTAKGGQSMTTTDPLVICLQDMGAHGYDAEVYPLSYALECAADFHTQDSPWEVLDIRYLTGGSIGEPVPHWREMVREELAERRAADLDNAGIARGIRV